MSVPWQPGSHGTFFRLLKAIVGDYGNCPFEAAENELQTEFELFWDQSKQILSAKLPDGNTVKQAILNQIT